MNGRGPKFNQRDNSIRELLIKSSSSSEFFRQLLELKQNANPLFSLRSWSKKLGYSNPSYLSNVLNGKRTSNLTLLERVLKIEKFSDTEATYLKNLILIETSTLDKEELLKVNSFILNLWKETEPEYYSLNLSVVDRIMLTYIEEKKEISCESLIQNLSVVIPENLARQGVEKLERENAIIISDDIISLGTPPANIFALPGESFLDLLVCFEKVFCNQSPLFFVDDLSFSIPKSSVKEAREVIKDAYEKLILLDERSKNSGQKRFLFSFFSTLFPVEKTE